MRLDDDALRTQLDTPTTEWRSEESLRDAAVVLPLIRREGRDHVVFTLRRDDLKSHAGQVSFPGGAREDGEDALRCALRETHEEIGLPGDVLQVLGRLPDRVSIAGYLVAVFVARLTEPRVYVADESEVAEIFEVPLSHFLERDRWRFRPLDAPRGRVYRVPYFDSDAHVVWGLTGIMMQDFLGAALDFDAVS